MVRYAKQSYLCEEGKKLVVYIQGTKECRQGMFQVWRMKAEGRVEVEWVNRMEIIRRNRID